MRKQISTEISEEQSGRTLGSYLKTGLGLTRAQIRRLKYQENALLVNGRRQRVTYVLEEGDRLEVQICGNEPETDKLVPTSSALDILYEDEDVICVWKPAGRVVHPVGCHRQDSTCNDLAGYFQGKGEPAAIRCIGRLDKDTSGVLVFAKHRLAAARLWQQKEKGVFGKEYLAVCEGVFSPEEYAREHTIDQPIGECPDNPGTMRVDPAGKPAVTRYQAMSDGSVRLHLATGRTHQIRVHMAWIGHPLVGDARYGSGKRQETMAQLCAHKAEFFQPLTGERIVVTREGAKINSEKV